MKSVEICRNLTKVCKSFHFVVRNVQKITRFYFNIMLDWVGWENFRALFNAQISMLDARY